MCTKFDKCNFGRSRDLIGFQNWNWSRGCDTLISGRVGRPRDNTLLGQPLHRIWSL